MRGKGKPGPVKLAASWIIPACAGKRLSLFGKTYPEQDHPRVCGEKLGVGAARIGCGGITPAYAGKSRP